MLYRYLTTKKIDNNLYKKNCNKQNSLLIPYHIKEYQAKERPNTAQYLYNGRKTIKIHRGSFYNSVSITKKSTSHSTTSSSQIYMKLDQRDKIEKIIKEESKKINFNKKINFVHHLSSEELKCRLFNKIPQNSYKRELKRKLKISKSKAKTFFETNKKEIKHIKKINFNNNINNLIKANKKLIRNVGSFSTGKEISYCKKNLNIVNNYFHKAAKEKERLSIIMTKKSDLNKKQIFAGFNYDNLYKNNQKLSEIINNEKYKKFKNKLLLRSKNKLKEKSRVFDRIMIDQINNNLEKIRSIKDDTYNRDKIDYVFLTNKILLTNLIKQMKIIYIKDPDMNDLTGNKVDINTDLRKVSLFDEFEDLSHQYKDDKIFSRYQKIKLALPKYIKTKFKKANYSDNYFGIPV